MPLATVLLDRDGVLNVKVDDDYVRRPADLILLPGAAAAVAKLNAAGVEVFVVTNQRGVARGLMTPSDLDAVHDRLVALLAAEGAHVDGIYACTHDRDACDCRKPLPGLVHEIVREHPGVDLTATALVGDSPSDIGLARAVGVRAVRIADVEDPRADVTRPTLAAAVELLLR